MPKKSKPKQITRKQFKAIRLKLGETQDQFAERLGYSNRIIIYMKEKGTRSISAQDTLLLNQFL